MSDSIQRSEQSEQSDQPPGRFRLVIRQLLSEVSPSDRLVWFDGERKFSAGEMLALLESGEEASARYTLTLVEDVVRGLLIQAGRTRKPLVFALEANGTPREERERFAIEHGPRQLLVAAYRQLPAQAVAWRTMSKVLRAHEFADALETRDPDATSILSDVLRVCRDLLSLRAQSSAEADRTKQRVGPLV